MFKAKFQENKQGKCPVRFEGKHAEIRKSWGEHEFTDAEFSALLRGEYISFQYKGQKVTGNLTHRTYMGNAYIGFNPHFHEKQQKAA